mmetsp:Transcript_10340/g.28452  ORF Transcript_10340/g.28452 Transcript_10340/m.28452 type:complete len:238 (+) Transcript_10340:1706-2419(+)
MALRAGMVTLKLLFCFRLHRSHQNIDTLCEILRHFSKHVVKARDNVVVTCILGNRLGCFCHDALRGSALANQRVIRQDQGEPIWTLDVVDSLLAAFQQDEQSVLAHSGNGICSKNDDFALGDFGDCRDVLRDKRGFECGVLHLRHHEVQAKTVDVGVVLLTVKLAKGEHSDERSKVFLRQSSLFVESIQIALLFAPCGRQQGDAAEDITIGPGHHFLAFVRFELLAQLCDRCSLSRS